MSTLIVADDDALFRHFIGRQLNRLGFQVIETDSGKDVIALIREHAPTACLIDIVMDEKEGIETIIEIGQLSPRPKVIAVSSNPLYLAFAADIGADDTLTKPVTPEALGRVLARLGIA